MATITKELQDSLRSLQFDRNFERFVEHLRASLEDTKTALVDAPKELVPTLQGKAQTYQELIKLTDTKPIEVSGREF